MGTDGTGEHRRTRGNTGERGRTRTNRGDRLRSPVLACVPLCLPALTRVRLCSAATLPPLLLVPVLLSRVALAQVPASAELWRLSAASLPGPAALEAGATAAFWNPAGIPRQGLAAGLQLVEAPEVVGVSGILAGVTFQASPRLYATVLLGRTDIGDLPRTTTSATTDLGSIPFYEQHVGLGGALDAGNLQIGVLLRGHDARFDALRENGMTVDAGVRLAVGSRLALAAATHFFPLNLTEQELTDYYGGLEYLVRAVQVWRMPSRIFLRYGASYRSGSGAEHGFGTGIALQDRLRVDAHYVREVGYGSAAWRPSLGVGLRVGRYAITAARAFSLNQVGATYRVGLDVGVVR